LSKATSPLNKTSCKGVIFLAPDYILEPTLRITAERLQAEGYEIIWGPSQIPPVKTEFPKEDWPRWFGRADVILMTSRSIITEEALAGAPRLRAVVFPTIGTESIDLAVADRLGIIVANGATPQNFLSMAEATVMLFTALFYDLNSSQKNLRDNLPRPNPDQLKARMIQGKTIGLVGFGRIARAVADRLAAWNVHILACDPYCNPANVPSTVELCGLDALLERSDLVSIHVALTPQTHHLMNCERLARMKPSAFLVNTARGGLVDEAALTDLLARGGIAGAALDVFEKEPLPVNSTLRCLENVILTSHMVGHTHEIFESIPDAAIANIGNVMQGRLPLYCRNPHIEPIWRQRLAGLSHQDIFLEESQT
jgi:phosphoglycerate dehydrogenase-like enzyme